MEPELPEIPKPRRLFREITPSSKQSVQLVDKSHILDMNDRCNNQTQSSPTEKKENSAKISVDLSGKETNGEIQRITKDIDELLEHKNELQKRIKVKREQIMNAKERSEGLRRDLSRYFPEDDFQENSLLNSKMRLRLENVKVLAFLRRIPNLSNAKMPKCFARRNFALIKSTTLSTEFFKIVTKLFGELELQKRTYMSSKVLHSLGQAAGGSDARIIFHSLPSMPKISDRIATAIEYLYATGWSPPRLLETTNIPFNAVSLARENEFALVYEQDCSKWSVNIDIGREMAGKCPECIVNSGNTNFGYFSGWMCVVFDVNVSAFEITCSARGDQHCNFILGRESDIEKQMIKLTDSKEGAIDTNSTDEGVKFRMGLFSGFNSVSDYNTDLKKAKQLAETQLAQQKIRHLELAKEKEKAQSLLHKMLPHEYAHYNEPTTAKIAELMRNGHEIVASNHQEVTMMFLDIVKFTKLSSSITPTELIKLLNTIYSSFDIIVDNYGLYKVETIGDAYMVVGNLLETQKDHANKVINLAMEVLREVRLFQRKTERQIQIHTGECLAGVLGDKMPRYVLFGECVKGSELMESKSEYMRIHVSESTYLLTKEDFNFEEDPKSEGYVIGNRLVKAYYIVGEKST